jgi:hypothetical protein
LDVALIVHFGRLGVSLGFVWSTRIISLSIIMLSFCGHSIHIEYLKKNSRTRKLRFICREKPFLNPTKFEINHNHALVTSYL